MADDNPHAMHPAGGVLTPPVVVLAYRALAWTWRYQFQGREIIEDAVKDGSVFAFWHGEQLPMVYAHAHTGLLGMASLSRDGELLARIISRLGYRVVRGSTSRGGSGAIRSCIREMREGFSPALAVDGPRGPWREPHVGAVALAVSGRCPIVYGVSSAWPAMSMSSWDRFVIPAPFARG